MNNTNFSSIDLIFTSNPNLVTELRIEKSHYPLFLVTFNVPLPPPYTREVWD